MVRTVRSETWNAAGSNALQIRCGISWKAPVIIYSLVEASFLHIGIGSKFTSGGGGGGGLILKNSLVPRPNPLPYHLQVIRKWVEFHIRNDPE